MIQYYCGITCNEDFKITHRLYLFDYYNKMMYCGDLYVKDIFFNSTFSYFKKINKFYFPISEEIFFVFLHLSWPNIEGSDFFSFIEIKGIEEWII